MRYPDVLIIICVILLVPALSGCELMGIKMPVSKSTNAKSAVAKPARAPRYTAADRAQIKMLQLMGYSRFMHTYPRARLKDEFKRVAADLAADPSEENQIRMAILLSIPDTSFKNDTRAMQLLSNIVNMTGNGDSTQDTLPGPLKDPLQDPLQEYAHLLLDNLQQRVDAEQTARRLSEELKAERQKRAQLQQQLDALRSIEKSINQRQLKNEAEKQ